MSPIKFTVPHRIKNHIVYVTGFNIACSHNFLSSSTRFSNRGPGGDETYINLSRDQTVNEKIKDVTEPANLGTLYLPKAETDNLSENCMLIIILNFLS